MNTFEEFKEMISKMDGMDSRLTLDPEQIKEYYREQCMAQIGQHFNLVLGFFMQNYNEMEPKQLHEWVIAIEKFFGITNEREGKITNFENEFQKIELTKQEKIELAEKNLAKSGIIF